MRIQCAQVRCYISFGCDCHHTVTLLFASLYAGVFPMSAGPCTIITKAGRPCGKTTGTQPSPDGTGVRCYSHMLPFLAKKDRGARCPVQKPRSAADVRRIVDWALVRAAEGKLSAPAANSVSSMAKTWLRVNADHSEETSNVLLVSSE